MSIETKVSESPLSDAIRAAIAESELSNYAISKGSDVFPDVIGRFIAGQDIKTDTARKLFDFLGLVAFTGSRKKGDRRNPLDALRAAIVESGLSYPSLEKITGVHHTAIRKFADGGSGLNLGTADRLFSAFPLKVSRSPLPVPKAAPNQSDKPFSDALRSAIGSGYLDIDKLAIISGVRKERIDQFMEGRDLKISAAGKLFEALSLAISREGKSVTDDPPTTLAGSLRDAMSDRRVSLREISRLSGLNIESVRMFAGREINLRLASADRLALAFRLKVVQDTNNPRPSQIESTKPLSLVATSLRERLSKSGLSLYELAKRSGTSSPTIRRFLDGKHNFTYETLIKLSNALDVDPVSLWKSPGSCPIELRGEGFPILVYGKEIPLLTGIAYELVAFAVERFREGGVCLPSELRERTSSTSDRPIKSLTAKLKEPGFEPLARVVVLPSKKGDPLKVIDPGPDL